MYKIETLGNGLKICSYNMPHMRSVSCGTWIRAGGRYENKKNSGISHFLEHLLFKGSLKRNARELKEAIEGVGGQLNGFTSEEFTCYFIKILDKKLNLSIDVLSDMLLNAKLSEEDLELERRVIMEEIKMYLDQPAHLVHDMLNEILFKDHPLGMPLAGTFESVKNITRKDVMDYKERFYNPSNIVFSGCGSIDLKGFKSAISGLFGHREKSSPVKFTVAKKSPHGPKLNVFFKETEQTHLTLGVYAPSKNNHKRFAMSLFNIILGGNMSSRLFQHLRENLGLAYDIGSHYRRYADIGSLVISAGVENSKLKEVLAAIIVELNKMKKEPPSAEELKRAKDFYCGQLLISMEDTLDHMMWLGENISADSKYYVISEIIGIVNKVSREQIRLLAKEILRDEFLNVAVIGPHKEKQAKCLKEVLNF